jgi:AcrR family transcriptional regulator
MKLTAPKKERAKVSPKRDPDESRIRILDAAAGHFGQVGFDAARVDAIARGAGLNKQLLYHYFGGKDRLFTRVLERAYQQFREKESTLDLERLPADRAILGLVDFTWKYYLSHLGFIRLLNSENQMHARHLKGSRRITKINSHHLAVLRELIKRGKKDGTVRPGLDPLQLSINIASLGFFYLINRYTLSTVFERNLGSPRMLRRRLQVMRDVIFRWIRPDLPRPKRTSRRRRNASRPRPTPQKH